MTNIVHINCQYYENKAFYEGGEAWKPKGGHKFQIEMDTDILMYCEDSTAIFSKMVEKHNTDLERFKYIDYEIIWQTPSVLGTVEDFLKLNSELAETNA
jgi:hypothetical protein|tara:strand:+ start:42 stop:338 length:297 start_codon:yes stop_codon:yes gene_type:complete